MCTLHEHAITKPCRHREDSSPCETDPLPAHYRVPRRRRTESLIRQQQVGYRLAYSTTRMTVSSLLVSILISAVIHACGIGALATANRAAYASISNSPAIRFLSCQKHCPNCVCRIRQVRAYVRDTVREMKPVNNEHEQEAQLPQR